MEKFQGKYRAESHRRRGWDYATEGAYFLTLCTNHRLRLFGEVRNGIMLLSDYGKIVEEEWLRSASLREEITLGVFQVMPDHFHAIVHLTSPEMALPKTDVNQKLRRSPRSISSLVAGFKATVTRRLSLKRLWQPNYHDRIIRSPAEYDRIAQYIKRNPERWKG